MVDCRKVVAGKSLEKWLVNFYYILAGMDSSQFSWFQLPPPPFAPIKGQQDPNHNLQKTHKTISKSAKNSQL